jgi:hypothetical protein
VDQVVLQEQVELQVLAVHQEHQEAQEPVVHQEHQVEMVQVE